MKNKGKRISIISGLAFLGIFFLKSITASAVVGVVGVNAGQGIFVTSGIVNQFILNDLTVSKISPQITNTQISIASQLIKNTKLEYRITIEKDGIKTVIKDFSITNLAMWIPKEAGTYKIYIELKDPNGRILSKTITFVITKPILVNSFTTSKVSGQYPGTAINVQATATGNGKIEYTYSIMKDGVKTAVKEYSIINTINWIPKEAGNYRIWLGVRDSTGKIVTKLLDYKILNPIKINSLVAKEVSSQGVGKTINVQAVISGDGVVQYKFSAEKDGVKTVIKEYSTSNITTWTPKESGNYKVTVEVKNIAGSIITKEISYIIDIPLIINKFTTDKINTQYTGTSVIIQGQATGSGEIKYKFEIEKNGIKILLKDFSTINTTEWISKESGSYKILLSTKDSTGKIVTRSLDYTIVNPIKVNSFTTSKVNGQYPGTTINVQALATGNGEMQYTYLVMKNGVKIATKEYSTVNTLNWTPKEVGSYRIWLGVRDTTGKIVTKLLNYEIINPLVVNSFTASIASPQYTGTPVIIKSTATGTGDVQYKYEIEKNGIKTIIKDFSSINIFNWAPKEAGTYKIWLTSKDTKGQIVSKCLDYVILNSIEISSLTASEVSPQIVGKTINLKAIAIATGNGTVQYKFTVDKNGVKTVIKDYSITNTIAWVPKEAGTYKVSVEVKNSAGIVLAKEINYVINNPIVINSLVVSEVSPQTVGKTINIQSVAAGNGAVQYKFTVEKNGIKTIIKDYSITNKIAWAPKEAGTYKISVEVKDVAGLILAKEISYVINNPVVISSLTVSDISPQIVGKTINLKATATGNGTVQYKFTVEKNGIKTIIKDYSITNKIAWAPKEAGTYKISVEVKDVAGLILAKEISYVINNPVVISSLTVSDISPQIVGKTINLKATATGNGTVQYKFTVEKNGVKTIIKDYSIINVVAWAPKEAGTYKVSVDVKDAAGLILTKEISYVINIPVVINSLTVSKVSPQNIGTAITLQGSAVGSGTVLYKYEIEKGGIKVVVKDYSITSTTIWTPKEAGAYKIILSVKDSNGLIATKEMSYLVNIKSTQLYSLTTSLGWKFYMKYEGKDLYKYIENGVTSAGLSITSENFMVTLMKNTSNAELIIKQTLRLALPTEADKVYNIISKPCSDQTLKLDGRTVAIYKSNGYTVAKVY